MKTGTMIIPEGAKPYGVVLTGFSTLAEADTIANGYDARFDDGEQHCIVVVTDGEGWVLGAALDESVDADGVRRVLYGQKG